MGGREGGRGETESLRPRPRRQIAQASLRRLQMGAIHDSISFPIVLNFSLGNLARDISE